MSRGDAKTFTGKLVRPRWFYRQWMLAGNRALFFDRLVRDFGDFVHYRGLFDFHLVNHPDLVKRVLQETHDAYDKRSVVYDRFRNAFGDGLVVSEGAKWKRQRGLLQQLFGPVTVKRYFGAMVDAASGLADEWSRRTESGTVFDVAHDMNGLALEIAGRAFFRTGFDQSRDRIHAWTHTVNHYSSKPPLPVVRSFWFPSPLNRRLKRTLRELHAFLQELIDERRERGGDEDLLSVLLQARDETTGEAMTDAEIRDEVLGMVIGGHETSSAALTWTWYELHRHPEVEARLHEEVDEVLGDGPLDVEDVGRLEYTRMVVEEALRLHPPFWFENRNVVRETALGGERLPAGSLVAFSRYSLHRHPDFWNDPERFDPERFRPGQEENRRSTYASVPFGGGPRICIGLHFAMLELVVVLALLARRHRLVVDASDRHEMAAALTMHPKYGVRVRAEPRQPRSRR